MWKCRRVEYVDGFELNVCSVCFSLYGVMVGCVNISCACMVHGG